MAGGDEVVDFGDGLANDPILAFGGADHFAELALAVRGDGDAAFFHFAVNHIAEVNFGDAAAGDIVYSDGFAGAAHTDNGDNFEVFHSLIVAYQGRDGERWRGWRAESDKRRGMEGYGILKI